MCATFMPLAMHAKGKPYKDSLAMKFYMQTHTHTHVHINKHKSQFCRCSRFSLSTIILEKSSFAAWTKLFLEYEVCLTHIPFTNFLVVLRFNSELIVILLWSMWCFFWSKSFYLSQIRLISDVAYFSIANSFR